MRFHTVPIWIIRGGIVSALIFMVGCSKSTPVSQSDHGSFVGRVRAEWMQDGRRMRLLENFGYTDPTGKLWVAPADSVVDGASIPQPFWSVIGGPFSGPYRNASVVHDIACDEKKEDWKDVHRMFYNACLCGGADSTKARVMFGAVYHFGPRWTTKVVMSGSDETKEYVSKNLAIDVPTDEQVQRLSNFVKDKSPTLEEIEKFDISKEPR
jgi:hypothetical protein